MTSQKDTTPDAADWLFPELGADSPEERGRADRLSAEIAKIGQQFSEFLPWYLKENPQWPENVAHEITAAAIESLREFLAGHPAPIPSSMPVEFRFPVKVESRPISPAFLSVEPFPPIAEIDPEELEAFWKRARKIGEEQVDLIVREQAAAAAAKGEPVRDLTPEQRAKAVQMAMAAAERLLAANKEKSVRAAIHTFRYAEEISAEELSRMDQEWRAANPGQEPPGLTPEQEVQMEMALPSLYNPVLREWFNAWRWSLLLREGWIECRPGAQPEFGTLTLWHFPAPERASDDPLWGKTHSLAFRLESLQALAERDLEAFQLPANNSQAAIEGKQLFDRLCPGGKLDRLKLHTLTMRGSVNDATGKEQPVSFSINIECQPLTFDFRDSGPDGEPETYFPLVIFFERGEGGMAWEELLPSDRVELFRSVLAEIEARTVEENWNFPGWDPAQDSGEGDLTAAKKKPRKAAKSGIPKAMARERIRPEKPKLKGPSDYWTHSSVIAKNITGTVQALLPFDRAAETALATREESAEITTVGFEFSALEMRVIEGMERLYEQYGFPASLELLTDIESFAAACGAEKSARAGSRFSPNVISDLLEAVVSISEKKGLMIYTNADGDTIRTAGFLWQPIHSFKDLSATELDLLKQRRLTPEIMAKLNWIGIRFDSIWRRAPRGTKGKPLYYHKPADLRDRLLLAGYRKRSRFTEYFLTWVYSEGEPIMHNYRAGRRPEAIIRIPLSKLAAVCRLEHFLHRGDRSRARKEIETAAAYAKAIGVITNDPKTAFDKDRGIFSFVLKDGKHWAELHAWIDEQAATRAGESDDKEARKKNGAPAATVFDLELEDSRQEKIAELDRRVDEYQKSGFGTDRKAVESLIAAWESERGKVNKEEDGDPGKKKATSAMLSELIKEGKARLAGGKIPAIKRQTPRLVVAEQPANREPQEQAPDPDPLAAAAWAPIRAAIMESIPGTREKLLQAIPCKLEETDGERRLVLALDRSLVFLNRYGEQLNAEAAAAGVKLVWSALEALNQS